MLSPPMIDGVTGEFRGVSTGANLDIPFVLVEIVEAMGNRDPVSQVRPIMVIDLKPIRAVGVSLSIEGANQFSFLVSILITGFPAAV